MKLTRRGLLGVLLGLPVVAALGKSKVVANGIPVGLEGYMRYKPILYDFMVEAKALQAYEGVWRTAAASATMGATWNEIKLTRLTSEDIT